jgi:predicted TIM-barrel fold metal-dependent hydrolase
LIVDLHCHVALSGRKLEPGIERFGFEPGGAQAHPGYDSYMSTRMLGNILWRFIRFKLGIPAGLRPGDELDEAVSAANERHLLDTPSVDRFVLLAFDEYHTAQGDPVGPILHRGQVGSDMYTSNSFMRHLCARHPEKFLFGASLHPYRSGALDALEEVHAAGAVLVKWLPVHQNIDPTDARVEAFVRRAGELAMPLLIHYGSELALRNNHRDQKNPVPMFDLLERIKRDGRLGPIIIAHVAAAGMPWNIGPYSRATIDALLRRFSDDPVYADISALTNKPRLLLHLLHRPALHRKLVYASDFPIPPATWGFPFLLAGKRRYVKAHPSWAEQTYRVVESLGFPSSVLQRGHEILRHRLP